ncbi:hypothetical protein OG21DRAFT_1473262 [Imleria badia]|nr:hypothetical protein OG21DRAFT_1473262 [Imleria badia]
MPNPADFLSESTLREIWLDSFDQCVYNDLPQYLIRISDMKLYSRNELWEIFRPHVLDTTPTDVEKARKSGASESKLRSLCKRHLKVAVFSHRWGSREPAFRDMSSKIYGSRPCPTGPGYEKLLRFCEKAKEYGCKYVWSDTCCINKESSAELEEAIHSMYRWYHDAFVCIVHLAESSSVEDFPNEPWFTRGWTLQELLAPRNLRMYGKNWIPICPKEEENTFVSPPGPLPNDKQSTYMLDAISKVTGIDAECVQRFTYMGASLSEKMRWASKRKTTRIEDVAYSLLGIFKVSMPIAYGEGKMAFRRLLEVIVQYSPDPTFFAWAGEHSYYSPALPSSPSCFQTRVTARGGGDHGYTIQKLGVQVKLLLIQMQVHGSAHNYKLQPLNTDLSYIMTVLSRLQHRPNIRAGEHCALGVVNFDRYPRRSGDEDEDGVLYAGKQYFCVLIKPSPASLPSSFGQPSLKLETGDVLPMIESKKEYRARPTTVFLMHMKTFYRAVL